MLYICLGILIVLVIYFFRSLIKLNRLSEDATLLVAYIKYAGKGKSSIFDNDKTDEEFNEEKFNRLLTACYLMNQFYLKTKTMPQTHRFHIRENGEKYGEIFEVQVGPFVNRLLEALAKITNSMPLNYQDRINAYMNNPFSHENAEIGEEIRDRLYPKSRNLKKYADATREYVKNCDYLYLLCK